MRANATDSIVSRIVAAEGIQRARAPPAPAAERSTAAAAAGDCEGIVERLDLAIAVL